jgi:D-alanyl-lipoteichoic acid acyltransferase DltB (MBOAT superfamily)
MLFNSIDFAIFLPIVFVLYWFVTNKNLKLQNFLVLVASYFFYGWWDWRFLSLIFFSTLVDYSIGILLSQQFEPQKRKILLWTSVVVNIGFLGFFKYYNFFIENFISAFSLFGMKVSMSSLNIVLPVGISFYTFQTLSYTIDVYRNKLAPTKDFIAFSSFVCFFPQLVAGPIERATNLLPQFYKKRVFNYSQAVDGMRQILWGLVKKVVIADNCAYYVNKIFNNSADYSGSDLALGAILFTIQVYGDFSGYSDIAIGTSRLFGFNLKRNFNFPFFSRDISEFWRRWHISLMSWFKDYLYIPLGGGRNGIWIKIRNIFIVFSLSGLWHGPNWNFIAWGVVTTIYFIPVLLVEKKTLKPIALGRTLPNWKEILSMLFTYSLVVPSFMFIRVDSIQHAFQMFSDMFSINLFSIPSFKPFYLFSLIIVFFSAEWVGRESQFVLDQIGLTWRRPFRWIMYLSLSIVILWFINKPQEFFYFQF